MARKLFSLVILLSIGLIAGSASAQSVESVYKGKNVDLLIGFGPGGGNDTWARTIAAHIGRFLPGKPSVIPRNMEARVACRSRTISTMRHPRMGACSA